MRRSPSGSCCSGQAAPIVEVPRRSSTLRLQELQTQQTPSSAKWRTATRTRQCNRFCSAGLMGAMLRYSHRARRAEHRRLSVGTASHGCLLSHKQGAHMRFVAHRAVVMRPLLAAAASVSILSQLCVSGCAVGPSYRKPPMNLEKFHNAAALQARAMSTPAPTLETWWDGFNDPMLSRLVTAARAQNLDLAAALARVQQARAVAREAGAQLLPTFDLNGQATRIHQSMESPTGQIASHLPGFNRDQSLYDVGLGASWELDLFGGLRRGREAASAEARAAIAEQVGIRISVTADAADAYLRIRGDQARITVAEQQVATDERLLDLVRQRFGRGLAAVREVAQAEALLSQARASLQPLRIDLEAQMNRLDVLLGVQPGTLAAELQTPRDIPTVPSVSANDRPLEVLRRRPDVIAAERRLQASNARIGQALADYYPKISLAGVLGYESSSPNDLFKAATFQM